MGPTIRRSQAGSLHDAQPSSGNGEDDGGEGSWNDGALSPVVFIAGFGSGFALPDQMEVSGAATANVHTIRFIFSDGPGARCPSLHGVERVATSVFIPPPHPFLRRVLQRPRRNSQDRNGVWRRRSEAEDASFAPEALSRTRTGDILHQEQKPAPA